MQSPPSNPVTAPSTAATADPGGAAVDQLLAHAPWKSAGQVQTPNALLKYDCTAEFLPVVQDKLGATGQAPLAAVMCTSYRVKAAADQAPRPVCFAFNGGPGSASIWLQLGAVGPKRVRIGDDGYASAPPYAVQDNPLTWLTEFDLVFLDPPHTGWALARDDEARKKVLSVDGDVAALTGVIRQWLTRHQRWNSAVYLVGESYGTTRVAALADSLQAAGVGLAGLVLVSCAMDLQTLRFTPANDLPYALFLPAMANTSQYHGLLKGPLGTSSQAAREAAEAFVEEDYLAALHLGARLAPPRRRRLAKRLSELTGLDATLVEQHNLRISDQLYFFEAMRTQGRIVGRLESRVTGPMGANRSRAWEFDPGIDAISGPYAMAGQAYFTQELGIDLQAPYQVINGEVNKGWNWNRGEAQGNQFASTTPDLARAMRRNPHLKVLVASGRYDLGTPYSATDWSLAQLDIPHEVRARLTHHYYDAGHMMYTREADLKALHRDLQTWLRA
jgi:carboxypeptidase C (cathepsin A)